MSDSQIKETLKFICHQLPENDISFLMTGGFAVNYHGYTRSTMDIDFMIASRAEEQVKKIMLSAGYTNYSVHDNVAFFQRPGTSLRVDFLRVDNYTMELLLSRSVKVDIDGTECPLPCLEDVVAMKLFAIQHGSQWRREKDIEDVVQLTVANSLNTAVLESLCRRYASAEIYSELCRKIAQRQTC